MMTWWWSFNWKQEWTRKQIKRWASNQVTNKSLRLWVNTWLCKSKKPVWERLSIVKNKQLLTLFNWQVKFAHRDTSQDYSRKWENSCPSTSVSKDVVFFCTIKNVSITLLNLSDFRWMVFYWAWLYAWGWPARRTKLKIVCEAYW